MTIKYPAWVCAVALVAVACSPQTVVPSPSPSAVLSPSPTASPGLDAPVIASTVAMRQRWQLVPDGFVPDAPVAAPNQVGVQFDGDPRPGRPVARVQPGGRETPLVGPTTGPNFFGAAIDLNGLVPGGYTVEIVEHLTGGAEALVGRTSFVLSQPEYVVWTLDFEGDASGDA